MVPPLARPFIRQYAIVDRKFHSPDFTRDTPPAYASWPFLVEVCCCSVPAPSGISSEPDRVSASSHTSRRRRDSPSATFPDRVLEPHSPVRRLLPRRHSLSGCAIIHQDPTQPFRNAGCRISPRARSGKLFDRPLPPPESDLTPAADGLAL